MPLLLFCFWALDADRPLVFSMCALLALATGELIGVSLAALGLWYAATRRKRSGLLIALCGVAWTLIALNLVVPAYSGGPSAVYVFYTDVGGSPGGVVETALTDLGAILTQVTGRDDLLYLFFLALPLVGAFVFAPALALGATPQIGACLLAGFSAATNPIAHYVAGVIPFLVAASAVGLGQLGPTGRARALHSS